MPPSTPTAARAGNISFTNEDPHTAQGNSTIPATNLREASTATSIHETLSASSGAYTLNLTLSLTDDTGLHQTAVPLTFHGTITGDFSHDNTNLTNTFGSDHLQSVNLGAYTFTIDLNEFTSPGIVGSTNAGAISAHVTITPYSNPHPTQDTPEPGTMLLAGLGMTFFGGAAWRKRRQARVAVAV